MSSLFEPFDLLQEVHQLLAPHAPVLADPQARDASLATPPVDRGPLHPEVGGHLLGAQEGVTGPTPAFVANLSRSAALSHYATLHFFAFLFALVHQEWFEGCRLVGPQGL